MKATRVGVITYPDIGKRPTGKCARCGIERRINERRSTHLCRDCWLVENDLRKRAS